jgi:hypothetical protein
MKTRIKFTRQLLDRARTDLERPHAFAHERVGFFTAGATACGDIVVLLAREYVPVDDADYLRNPSVGATIGSNAMRKALQFAYRARSSLLHVHSHGGRGLPEFSGVDLKSGAEFVPAFFHAIPRMPHGMVVLSTNSASAKIWFSESETGEYASGFASVGAPLVKFGERP